MSDRSATDASALIRPDMDIGWGRRLRAVGRIVRMAAYLWRVSLIMRWRFEAMDHATQQANVRKWSAAVFHCLGAELVVKGAAHPGAKLIVGNHVSWMDIMAINATVPSRFVSKAEVGQWPIVGRMVTLAGTIYLERARRRDAMRAMGLLTQTLRDGHTAAVFPEGTTGDGHRLLHFHANLLQSAIDADVPVQPIAIRYSDAQHAISPAAAYVGDTSLVRSLWWIACAQDLTVNVTVLPPERVTHADRRALAMRLHDEIAEALSSEL
jgi:1-acyl-sn-glycerol-3-phosphate acyltransferase